MKWVCIIFLFLYCVYIDNQSKFQQRKITLLTMIVSCFDSEGKYSVDATITEGGKKTHYYSCYRDNKVLFSWDIDE